MKRAINIIIILFLFLSLVACNKQEKDGDPFENPYNILKLCGHNSLDGKEYNYLHILHYATSYMYDGTVNIKEFNYNELKFNTYLDVSTNKIVDLDPNCRYFLYSTNSKSGTVYERVFVYDTSSEKVIATFTNHDENTIYISDWSIEEKVFCTVYCKCGKFKS